MFYYPRRKQLFFFFFTFHDFLVKKSLVAAKPQWCFVKLSQLCCGLKKYTASAEEEEGEEEEADSAAG